MAATSAPRPILAEFISLPRFTRRAGAVWLRNFTAWRKFARSSVLLNFGEPVMNLLSLGLGLGAYVTRIGHRMLSRL